MTESDNKSAASKAVARPGREMKKIREQAAITLAYIAERTLISEARLNALENDDYDNVGSVAYITGYARAYAKVVGFDPTRHIEALEEAVGFEREQVVTPDVDYKPLPRRRVLPPLTTLAGAVLVVVILVLAVSYWLTGESETTTAARPQSASLAVPSSESDMAPSPRAEVGERASPTTVSLPVTRVNRDEPALPQPSVEDPSPSLDAAAADPNMVQTAAAVEPSIARASAPVGEPFSELVIEFSAECWLRVMDAQGNRLIENVRQAGDIVRLSGVAPFNIRLGNARAVDIELNGDAVPVQPRPGQRTLVMNVGG